MSRHQCKWLIGVLPQHSEVLNLECIGSMLVRIERKDKPPAIVEVTDSRLVEAKEIDDIINENETAQFVVNMRNLSDWTQEAISKLKGDNVAFGYMYDLYRALNNEEILSDYLNPEIYYAERVFRQNHAVICHERLAYRLYRISRARGKDITIALLPSYEVTADEVRTVFDKYKEADIIMKTNPYGRISAMGREAASKLGLEVMTESEVFEYLSR